MKDHTGDASLDILLKTMRLPSILQQYRQVAAEAEQEGWGFYSIFKATDNHRNRGSAGKEIGAVAETISFAQRQNIVQF